MSIWLVLLVALSPVRVSTWDGPEHLDDYCTALAPAAGGGAVLAGYSLGQATDFQFTTVGFDSAGSIAWSSRLGAPLGSEDRAWCVLADDRGGAVAAGGSIADVEATWDFFWAGYNAAGETLWTRRLDFGPGHGEDRLAALSAGPDGGFFLAGRTRPRPDTAGHGWDAVVARCAANGETLWTRRLDRGRDDQFDALAVDRAGNSYSVGRTAQARGGTDVLVASWDSLGRERWSRTIAGRPAGSDFATGVLLDRAGGPVVFGTVQGLTTGFDYLVAAYDSAGNLRRQDARDGAGSVDIAQAGCLDREGNVVVTGVSAGRGSSVDILTVKYSPGGETLWTRRWNGPMNGEDRGMCVACSEDGRVFVAGTSAGAGGQPELVLVGYSPGGEPVAEYRREGGEARPAGLAFTGERLLVAGHARGVTTGLDMLLLEFRPDAAGR